MKLGHGPKAAEVGAVVTAGAAAALVVEAVAAIRIAHPQEHLKHAKQLPGLVPFFACLRGDRLARACSTKSNHLQA